MKKRQKAEAEKRKPEKNRQTPEKAGLTFSEKKRLAQLKRILAGNSREQAKPDTAQKTITFKKMYRDGICQVTDNYYTKMVEFFDINYDLLEVEDQADILEEYSKLINYFDPSIKFQLFLFNRQVSEQALAEQFDISLQDDDFDDIREEYTQMLKHQSAKGNNGIIKSKYLIFGVESTGFKEAKSKLNNIEKDVIHNLNNIGTNARGLDGKERLRILHEYFNQGTMEPFRFSFKELSESGKSVKDYIAPPGFDFRYPSRFKSGSIYGSVSYLDIIAPRFTDELLKKLLDIDDNLTLTMHMQTFDPVEAIKMLKRALTDIQKNKIEEQKKAVRSGYDMDILPTDIVTYEKDTLELLDDLNTSNQKLIKMTFLITCYGRTKRELENLTQRVSGIIQQANCNLRCLQYLQEQGLMASAPIGCNDTGIERNLTTKSTAVLVPFCTQELFMPAPAIYYGLNALSNNMIMADRKRLRTPNGVILGTPGSGKSFSAKREILSCFLITRDDIIVCDPEGEYFPLVQALHGQVVRLATNSRDFLNPMDIQLSHKGDKEALKLKSDFLITLCDLIAGGKNGLENAGNMSEVYKTANPYYTDPEKEDSSEKNPAEQLPVNAEAAKPSSATAQVTEHTKTDSDGNTVSELSPAEQKKQSLSEAAKAEAAASEKEENSGDSEKSEKGKEFYTIQTASEKVFYLVIDRDGEEEVVYFLTEVTENDLLNVTTDNSETLPKNSAALESAIPATEGALPNNNGEEQEKEEETTEEATEEGSGEVVEEPEPEPEPAKENPAATYIILGIAAAAAIGGGYYFKVVKGKKEEFLDEDDDGDEEEEYDDDEENEDIEDDFFDSKDGEDE